MQLAIGVLVQSFRLFTSLNDYTEPLFTPAPCRAPYTEPGLFSRRQSPFFRGAATSQLPASYDSALVYKLQNTCTDREIITYEFTLPDEVQLYYTINSLARLTHSSVYEAPSYYQPIPAIAGYYVHH